MSLGVWYCILDVGRVTKAENSVFHVVQCVTRMGFSEKELPELFHVVRFFTLSCGRSNENYKVFTDQETLLWFDNKNGGTQERVC